MSQTDSSPRPQVAFSVLGPLVARVGDVQLSIGGPVQRRVLAMLLLEPGHVVSLDRLVDAVWDEDPPSTAAHQIRKAAASLRKRVPCGHAVIVTEGPGYRVDVTRCRLDLLEFDERMSAARAALKDGAQEAAVNALWSALSLWRGAAVSGVDAPVIRAAATALDERRLSAAEQVFELSLSLGECGPIIPELRALIAEHPLRETLRAQLMLALYRTGRQAEALDEYARIRELLRDTLGIDPGIRIADLHASILNADPDLGEPSPPVPVAAKSSADVRDRPFLRARTLPSSLRDFTGRSKELARLLALMNSGTVPAGRSPRIIAIDGMGGVGKTSLAIEAAHRVGEHFPDGQLAVDLRGFTPGVAPLAPMAALNVLLRAVGLPDDRIPDNIEARSGLWQSLLADRRLLILLDNAAGTQQLQHLLPASSGCLVLVTSRAKLLDLDGAAWISVDHMSPEESVALIGEILPAERVQDELPEVRELADLCGHLPLALRIAAARVASRPGWTIRYMVDRLRDEGRRLTELRSNERSVAATLHLSYVAMPEAHRRALRILGIHPGTTMDLHSTAALLGMRAQNTEDVLESLVDANLLQQPGSGIYAFHDLVRNFAHSVGGAGDDGAAAIDRLLDYYANSTDAACDVLFPGRARRFPTPTNFTAELPPIETPAQAGAWFEREHRGLLALVALAVERERDWHAVILARNLNFHLNTHGRLDDLWDVGQHALTAARRLGELEVLCVTLSNFSSACWKLGRIEESLQAASEARDVAISIHDRSIEAHSGLIMGLLMTEFGQYTEALTVLQHSIVLSQEIPSPRTEAECLTTFSTLYERQGLYQKAATAAREAIVASRAIGYRDNELMATADLALAQIGLESYGEARQTLALAHDLCDETSSLGDVGLVAALSATVEQRLGREADSRDLAARALRMARSSNSRARLVRVSNLLGSLYVGWQDYDTARTLYGDARKLAAAMKFRADEAAAHQGLATVAEALGAKSVAAEQRIAAEG
ncbi:BTAD domain-containing putative transcriptional regulator [Promicromonospora alba]|uniref:BTAD domain-containing putative transcriptional regulator n=1 Tax=Promicromonospora alba TaxID=1616110 RepID=A0ABV9HHG1_9MICO